MVLEFGDWKLEVDVDATMAYSAQEAREHCTCAYCRNFYGAMDVTFPKLSGFLSQFGLDLKAPDELMPFTATNMLVIYAVSGKILQYGSSPIMDCGIRIDPEPLEVSMINTECPRPAFALSIGPFDIPWVLDEPLVEEEIVSPANEESFLRKMFSRLLAKTKKNVMNS